MRRALIVDDEPLLRRQVAEILENYGFDEILEAEDGSRALEIVRHQEILLVVMDVGMPGIDAITTAEKIGKLKPLPVVLLTATADTTTPKQTAEYLMPGFPATQTRAERISLISPLP